uniref:RRM domain-containing protein n=1 Tax=Oryza barthii TaxID=65489 RepID=A0A0D3F6P5_9ORYZ
MAPVASASPWRLLAGNSARCAGRDSGAAAPASWAGRADRFVPGARAAPPAAVDQGFLGRKMMPVKRIIVMETDAVRDRVVTIKVIRNRQTGQSEGYGFVEFYSHGSAEKALQNFTGHVMPNTDRPFKLNWASYSMGEKRSEVASDYSIFVGDLAADVTDEMLMELFANKYRSVKGAKVIIDANTGRSRGYGFVRFGDDNDKSHAMTEMNGAYCSTRPIRIGPATPRRSSGDSGSSTPGHSDGDSTNRTVYVGGLDPNVSEDELRKAFAKYGDVASVKIPLGKQCGFVQFVSRTDAEEALQGLNGSVIGKQAVRLSWGRSPSHKQSRADSGSRRNNMYYGTPFYGGYGYASPVPHPNMYAAAYGAYPVYGSQQLVS